jgi:hypothetical protein
MRSKQNPTIVNVTPNPRKFLASTRKRIEDKQKRFLSPIPIQLLLLAAQSS